MQLITATYISSVYISLCEIGSSQSSKDRQIGKVLEYTAVLCENITVESVSDKCYCIAPDSQMIGDTGKGDSNWEVTAVESHSQPQKHQELHRPRHAVPTAAQC
jgi:hypothetical protein